VTTGPDAVLEALDPEQREVALATKGPVCVLAGAGTGKTRAVAHRIAYAAATGVVDPGRVLAVTFTARAAGELRARLRQLGASAVPGAGLERAQARTFHAAALRQLTHFWPATVGGPPPRVLDSKVPLLAEAARHLRIRPALAELRDVAAEIEWAKVTQVRPDVYAQACSQSFRTPPLGAELLARLYAAYEELCRERHVVDFESVLELTAAILAEHPAAAVAVRDRYSYFVVDEYQDVNPLQKLLLETWAGDRDDVCVVGDPRQTIYSFAGATPSYLTGFPAEYPDATVIRLVRNYRSTPQIVELANRLCAAGRAGPGGTGDLVAHRGPGPMPEFAEHADEQQEAAAVARRAAALIRDGTPAREIAILVRVNAQTAPFEQALTDAGVPFLVKGAERFFDRPVVRQAVGLLRVAARSADAEEGQGSEPNAGAGAAGPAGSAGVATPHPAMAQVRAILTSLGLTREPPAGRGEARERWESLEALGQLAEGFFAVSPAATLADLSAELALRSSMGHAPALDGVTLASLHAAKGLEWEVVFLPGLTDGTLPIVYAQTEDALAEERRLLYVGVTRARSLLSLSWALARSPGGRKTGKPSRFLTQAAPRSRPASRPRPRACDGDPLFLRLREWRRAAAAEQGVPAYVIFSDATLGQIAARRPASSGELAAIPGVGPVKLDRYGAAVLALCAAG
jgi:DNA helicase-2/ATP-dependent DNA helicase PcrA